MSDDETDFNFNHADKQRSFDLIPVNTLCVLQMTVRPGGAGGRNDNGWLTRASTEKGISEALDTECVIVGGPYAKRKVWHRFTIRGTTKGHADAGVISMKMLRAIVESARGIHPEDKSEAAELARIPKNGWADFDGLRFMARLGVQPPKGPYAAKNTILEIITPDQRDWAKVEQINDKPVSVTPAAPTATPPAGSITRPEWGK